MTENKSDQHSQQPPGNSVQQATQHSSDSDLNKANIHEPEPEERNVVIPDQRRPQFRYNENYRRKNF